MGKKIAMLVGDDFEDSEFRVPYDSLKKAGHEVTIIGARKGETLAGKQGKEKVQAEAEPGQVQAQSFDAMVIPGGYGPDHLRMHDGIVNFVREFCDSGRPVAAVCHGPQLLIEAGKVKGKTMTAWPSVRGGPAGGNRRAHHHLPGAAGPAGLFGGDYQAAVKRRADGQKKGGNLRFPPLC